MANRFSCDELRKESIRLKTYESPKWNSASFTPSKYAAAGFFFTETDDIVQCPFCSGVVCKWRPRDDPFMEHYRFYPNCPFVNGVQYGNISKNIFEEISKPVLVSPTTTTADRLSCKICFSQESNVAFVPCGHVIACKKCSKTITCCGLCHEKIFHRMDILIA